MYAAPPLPSPHPIYAHASFVMKEASLLPALPITIALPSTVFTARLCLYDVAVERRWAKKLSNTATI